MQKKKGKKPISEEQRKSLLERLELARAANPNHNPILRASNQESSPEVAAEGPEVENTGLRPHLTGYLQSPKSVRDFEVMRKKSPEKALEFATERVWGARSGAGNGKKPQQIGILVKVLTGSHPIPDRDSLPQDIVVEVKSDHDTDTVSQ